MYNSIKSGSVPEYLILFFSLCMVGTVMVGMVNAEHPASLSELVVSGEYSGFNRYVLDPDLIKLLKKIPGANINSNGTVTGIAQYRGMYGDRINILIDDIKISSGGPNAMDTPISYIPRAQLKSLEVIRGIAPVSSGNETIGGTIRATSTHSTFTKEE